MLASRPFAAALAACRTALQAGMRGMPESERMPFAEGLINRLIWLKFVEAKGWLDHDRNALWNRFRALGVTRFCWEIATAEPLLPLELCAPATGWHDDQVTVDAAAMEMLFDQLLNAYVFTCDPLPPREGVCTQETLGYAHEHLIADQHGCGAYYTHPAEVVLMCRESLRSSIDLACPHLDPSSRAAIIDDASPPAAPTPTEALALYTALHSVTICDPAAGSGMFLVAMLQQIWCCMRSLGTRLADHPPFVALVATGRLVDPCDDFALKAHIIGHSLHGCDIDRRALEIARLRLWLELLAVCDQPPSLPNLAQRLIVGDALVGAVGRTPDGTLVTLHEVGDDAHLQTLATLKQRYFGACDAEERQQLRAQIATMQEQIIQRTVPHHAQMRRSSDHVLWPLAFPAVFEHTNPGFDIVIGNPPYVRQELINTAFAACDPPISKRDLQAVFRQQSGYQVKGTADLYVYFFLRGLLLLRRSGGTLCYICSNAWLDVDYGEVVQRAVVDHTAACRVYASQTTRSFDAAGVNTAITLLQTAAAPQTNRQASFIALGDSFNGRSQGNGAHMLTSAGADGCRVTTVAYDDLGRASQGSGYWGAQYLRAPSIYQHFMAAYGAKFVPLAAIATLRFGIKTGANAFFHLDRVTAAAWQIEPEYLVPIVRTPRECAGMYVDPRQLRHHLLLCHQPRAALAGSRVLEYIRWGEEQGFHQRPSCRHRARWYDVGTQAPANFIALRFRDLRHWTPLLPPDDLAVGDTVFTGTFRDQQMLGVGGALLNTTLFALMSEVFGRGNLGHGLLTTYGPELLRLPVVDPSAVLPHALALTHQLQVLAQRPVRPIPEELQLPDRQALDALVFDILGLTAGEREAVYAAVAALVEQRIRKARSLGVRRWEIGDGR